MENAIFARGLQAFQEELHQRGDTLLVSSAAYQSEVEQEQIRALVSRGADALLLIGYDRAPSIYQGLRSGRVWSSGLLQTRRFSCTAIPNWLAQAC